MVEPGALFVALKGEQADGHEFVAQALADGAVAAIVERDVEAEATRIDLTKADLKLPGEWTLPLLLQTDNVLAALQKLATYWRSRHDVRVVGITGSVGKTTTKELISEVIIPLTILSCQTTFR